MVAPGAGGRQSASAGFAGIGSRFSHCVAQGQRSDADLPRSLRKGAAKPHGYRPVRPDGLHQKNPPGDGPRDARRDSGLLGAGGRLLPSPFETARSSICMGRAGLDRLRPAGAPQCTLATCGRRFRSILPAAFLGSASTRTKCLGTNTAGSFAWPWERSAPSSSLLRETIAAQTLSSPSGLTTPKAAASATPSNATRTSSIFSAFTLSPPMFTIASCRPATTSNPSDLTDPMSPG